MKPDNKTMALMTGLLVGFGLLGRLIPHPPNFVPIAAIAIFGGALLPRRAMAIGLPLAVMVLSDLIIGLHPLVAYTWCSFIAVAAASYVWLKNPSVIKVTTASIVSSVLFFLVTNFGVWQEGRMYAMTLSGLVQCYYNGVPFFRNTLIGDLVYTAVLFGTFELSRSGIAYFAGWRKEQLSP